MEGNDNGTSKVILSENPFQVSYLIISTLLNLVCHTGKIKPKCEFFIPRIINWFVFISLSLIEKHTRVRLREMILLFVFAIGLCKVPEGKLINYGV